MIPGDTINLTIWRQTAAGAASTGKVLADFTIPAYLDGASASITWTATELATSGAWRGYKLSGAIPSTAGFLVIGPIQPASGTDVITPDTWTGEIEAYDKDSLAGLLQTSQGIPGVQSAAEGNLGDVVMGDSWQSGTLTVPLGKISQFGYSDLSGMTISVALKSQPSDSPVSASASIVSAGDRTVKAYWDSFPAGLNLSSTETSKTWYLDIQLKHTGSGRIITALRYSLNVVWQRDTTT